MQHRLVGGTQNIYVASITLDAEPYIYKGVLLSIHSTAAIIEENLFMNMFWKRKPSKYVIFRTDIGGLSLNDPDFLHEVDVESSHSVLYIFM